MSLTAWLYWFDVIGNLQGLIIIILLGCAAVFVFGLIPLLDDDGSYSTFYFRYLNKAKHLLWLALFLVFLPSKTTLYLMAGAEVFERSDIPPKVQEAVMLKLDDVIKELKEKDKK